MLVPQMLHAIGDGGDEFDLRRGASVQIFFHQGQLPKKTIILLLASLSLPERLRADTAPSWPHMIIAMVALKLAGPSVIPPARWELGGGRGRHLAPQSSQPRKLRVPAAAH